MKIKKNVRLNDKIWFSTGGSAQFYAAPESYQDFIAALSFAAKLSLKIFVLGEGANVLVSDEGFKGLVIRPVFTAIDHKDTVLQAQAGASMDSVIDYALQNRLGGLEDFSGIPGTVGGSVYINIHYFELLLSHFLCQATVIEKKSSKLLKVDNAWFDFGYNQSRLQKGDYFLLSASFSLKKLTSEETFYARGRRDEIIRQRSRRYPIRNTCGSFFRNFTEEELVKNGMSIPFIGYYLDKVGVKGVLKSGGAQVSYKHANMIVTCEQALTKDVILLAKKMQEEVYAKFGILPQPECCFIGFDRYPLHTAL